MIGTRRRLSWLRLALIVVVVVFVAAVAGTLWLLHPSTIKLRAERGLSERLGLPVTIGDLRVTALPRPRLTGSSLVVTMPSAPSSTNQPFLTVDRFSADIGPLSVWRGYVANILVEGLRVVVPPGSDPTINDARLGSSPEKTIVGRLEARDTVLTFLRKDPAKEPLEFRIHQLAIDDVGFGRVMRFSTSLTNPVPHGLVESSGTIGPWNRAHPLALPVAGGYRFTMADLGTIRGIGGTLTSAGRYEGHLEQIVVTGTTTTPDFSLDLGGSPVPLTTDFRATVDASDGTTQLDRVEATLFSTSIFVTGRIDNLPGPGRRDIDLTARIANGRLEDVLRLVTESGTSPLAGDVTLSARVRIPPGRMPVKSRIRMEGAFGLNRAIFQDDKVQARLFELSRRSQGKDAADDTADGVTSLAGSFTLASGVIALDRVTFDVPGAAVRLGGTFVTGTGELDLAGQLRMQASVSSAVGGVRSIFLKPFDWVFRRDGVGAVVPIQIKGTFKQPEIGVDMRRVFTRGGNLPAS